MKVIDLKAPNEDPIFALCYGDSGSGKTHLAGTLGEIGTVLICEVDQGQKTLMYAPDLAKARDNLVVCSFDKFKDLDTAYRYLQKNDPAEWNKLFGEEICTKPFDWFVWDTWSELQWNMLEELRSKDSEMKGVGLNFRKNLQIQHWGMMTDLNKLAIEQLRECKKINQLFLMQQTMTKDDLSGQIFGGPAIHGKLVQEIPAYFDVVIRTYANLAGKFCATTKPVGKWTAKTRLGVGKEYIDPKAKEIFA